MDEPLIEKLIKLNHKVPQPSLKEIATEVKLTPSYVWKLLKADKRYKPGKRGFASLSNEDRKRVASKGGITANVMGYGYKKVKKS